MKTLITICSSIQFEFTVLDFYIKIPQRYISVEKNLYVEYLQQRTFASHISD